MSSLKSTLKCMSAAALLAMSILPNTAYAVDMLGEPVFEETTQVEFGTGWYIRGDLGVSGEVEYSNASFGNAITGSIGAGYMLGDTFRAEVLVNQFANLRNNQTESTGCGTETTTTTIAVGTGFVTQEVQVPITGDCFVTTSADPYATTLVANAYYDMPEWFGVRPYVGAGLGVAFVSWGEVTEDRTCEATTDADCGAGGAVGDNELSSGSYENDGQLAATFNLMLGASYKLSQNMHLDAGYRYTMISAVNDFRGDESSDLLHVNEFRVGLRYEIW